MLTTNGAETWSPIRGHLSNLLKFYENGGLGERVIYLDG